MLFIAQKEVVELRWDVGFLILLRSRVDLEKARCVRIGPVCAFGIRVYPFYMEKKCLVVGRYTQQSRPWKRTWKIWEYSGLLSVSQSIICEDVGVEGTDRRLYVVFSTAEIGGTRLCFRN